jgi:hypothetical protein
MKIKDGSLWTRKEELRNGFVVYTYQMVTGRNAQDKII